MKKIIILCLSLILSINQAFAAASTYQHEIPKAKGKWLVVNYWAEWCGPCLTEMPELDKFYREHKKDVLVLGVNYEKWPANALNTFAEKFNISFPLLSDFPREKYRFGATSTLPVTFIISPQGKLVATLNGPQKTEDLLKIIKIRKSA